MEPVCCIVCGRTFKDVFGTGGTNTPNDGIVFQAKGNYGSTVFDPGDGTYLEINICDNCIKERKDRVLYGKSVISKESTLIPWDGEIG